MDGRSQSRTRESIELPLCTTSICSKQCAYSKDESAVKVNGYMNLASGDELALKKAVANTPAVIIGMDASPQSFMFYSHGVYSSPQCQKAQDALNHAVIVVGYGTDEHTGQDYWCIKNSWGATWGQGGYGRIARNSGNTCGIATDACYPTM